MANKAGPKKALRDKRFNARPKQKKLRAKRNAARLIMIKAGRLKKGSKKDVDHKRSLSNGGSNKKSNLRVVSRKLNRGKKRVKDQRTR